jgi:hypothetical protein
MSCKVVIPDREVQMTAMTSLRINDAPDGA